MLGAFVATQLGQVRNSVFNDCKALFHSSLPALSAAGTTAVHLKTAYTSYQGYSNAYLRASRPIYNTPADC